MLDVIEVVAQFEFRLVWCAGIAAVHLGPAGDARQDKQAHRVFGNDAFVAARQIDCFRAGANKAHVADQDIVDLR
ncbi:hypothetical protein D3C86_2136190 [compost metagenome]